MSKTDDQPLDLRIPDPPKALRVAVTIRDGEQAETSVYSKGETNPFPDGVECPVKGCEEEFDVVGVVTPLLLEKQTHAVREGRCSGKYRGLGGGRCPGTWSIEVWAEYEEGA